jgi:hypothetical protein
MKLVPSSQWCRYNREDPPSHSSVYVQAIQNIQELTLNLVVVCPGHTPNWEMVADMVNMISHIYRSPRQCKNRFVVTARLI